MTIEMETQLHTIQEAIEDIKNGKVVIVVDDEDRENEGDFVAAAELITPEIINFMSTHGRGLICTPLPEKRCDELGLDLMVRNTTDPKETAFTVSIDLIGDGVTTGISAKDRAKTILALMNENTKAADFARPGHIFPLRAKEGGVLKRPGHTEATIDLAKLAGLQSGGVIVEIMNEDGSMARLNDLMEIAKKFDLKIISIKDLIAYRLKNDSLIERISELNFDTIYGNFDLIVFKEKLNNQIHYALSKGKWNTDDTVLVRVMASNHYNDFFTSLIKGEQHNFKQITDIINTENRGVIIFLNNYDDSESMEQKVNHFKQFVLGNTPNPSPVMDTKEYGIGAQIIKELGIENIKLIVRSNNTKYNLAGFGLEIKETIDLI